MSVVQGYWKWHFLQFVAGGFYVSTENIGLLLIRINGIV